MSVNLLTNISGMMRDPSVHNWFSIRNLIPTGNLTEQELDLARAHDSTFYKIRFADYHLFILGQIYDPNARQREGEIQHWVRAEMHSIVYNLYSALDSLGYEINLAYGFTIPPYRIHFDHDHDPTQTRNNCLRCELRKINDDLHCYLDRTLSQPWFDYFRRLRNQVTHRHFPPWNLGVTVGGNNGGGTLRIRLPDDPEIRNPGANDYLRNLELRQYCEDTREDVRKVIEEIYPRITPKIKQRYGFP
jgi:hypothetical protein